MDPGLVEVVKAGELVSAAEFVQAQVARNVVFNTVRQFFQGYDLLLTPTLAVLPFEVGRIMPLDREGNEHGWINWTPFSYPFTLTRLPAATVPAGFSAEGMPVGLQTVGRRPADLTVLQAAAAFEEARPWADKRPTL